MLQYCGWPVSPNGHLSRHRTQVRVGFLVCCGNKDRNTCGRKKHAKLLTSSSSSEHDMLVSCRLVDFDMKQCCCYCRNLRYSVYIYSVCRPIHRLRLLHRWNIPLSCLPRGPTDVDLFPIVKISKSPQNLCSF